jgi:hypothetical protein
MKNIAVISHFNEDLSWLDNVEIEKFIVSKTLKDADIYQKINRGNESSSYLEFIINNYEEMDSYDRIIFLHGHRMSWHQKYESDFLLNKIALEIDIEYLNFNDEYYYEIFTDKVISSGKVNYVSDNKVYLILKEVWDELFLEDIGEQPNYIGMIPGAQFTVNPKLILRRSKLFYLKLLNWIYSEKSYEMDIKYGGNGNTYSSRVLEWTWNIILNNTNKEIQIKI